MSAQFEDLLCCIFSLLSKFHSSHQRKTTNQLFSSKFQCRKQLFISVKIFSSNKYGFGYQLSDKTIGVLFNEGTRICQSASSTPPPQSTTTQQQTQIDISSLNQHLQCYEYTDLQRKSVAWTANSPPPSFVDLSSKLKLLDYFSRYMDEHLAEGVVSSLCSNQMRVSTKHQSMIPQVVRWRRNPNAVIMELNVNYFFIFYFSIYN